VVELATAAGLGMLPDGVLRPMEATTAGLGTVVAHALDEGAEEIVIGLGGSASTDGGAGLLTGLGARVLDDQGHRLPPGGAALVRAARLDLSGLHPRAHSARFVFACDVDNPLLGADGAAAVYGPQKGADPAQVRLLDTGLARWAQVLLGATGRDVTGEPGAGAAGGAMCGAAAVLDVTRRSGVATVLALTGFDDTVRGADLVVTGEGRLDRQSLHGKAPIGVAIAARAAGATVLAVAGETTLDSAQLRAAGFVSVYTLTALAPDRATAITEAAPLVRRVGAMIASRSIHHPHLEEAHGQHRP
jgi:glycerate kinase